MQASGSELWVDKADIVNGKLNTKEYLMGEKNVILKIDKFAYTSNNTTYAVTGDWVGYWKFFATSEKGKGIIPAWGFAEVVTSQVNGIAVGERFYGYYPMADYLVVKAGKINKDGFIDISEHRRELPVIYNHYMRTSNDALYSEETEDVQLLFRPLFTTSYLINHMFKNDEYYNSDQIILTSASSKTALGLSHCFNADKTENSPSIIGLTSERNVTFVEASGYYDKVLNYKQLDQLDQVRSSIVDFSGNNDLQADLQEQLGDQLMYNCLVGMVHWEDRKGSKSQSKKGEFFFAPTYAKQLIDQVGPIEFYKGMAGHFLSFIQKSKEWLHIEHHDFQTKIEELHKNITIGNLSPKDGHIIKL